MGAETPPQRHPGPQGFFSAEHCRPCPKQASCTKPPSGRRGRGITFLPRERHEALEAVRQAQETDEWKDRYAIRAPGRRHDLPGRPRHRSSPNPLPQPAGDPPRSRLRRHRDQHHPHRPMADRHPTRRHPHLPPRSPHTRGLTARFAEFSAES
ncbi:transposase [Streptomyces sp. CA-142005]|uniref:transposase n=1 Tax=Streptomyces sp. CA-142005 TaxID=3240052 RepID=UPI003D8EB8CF